MNIGFVTTWLPRGAAYVTVNYIKLVQPEHKAFIYARGGEYFDSSFNFEDVPVHKGLRLENTNINSIDFVRWIKKNSLDMVIFNEQDSIEPVCIARKKCKNVIFGSYVDYYKESTISDFNIYDFLICNTRRHMSVFSWHPQCLYLAWGTDINLYTPKLMKKDCSKRIIFFHSMGMSNRKGTEILVKTYIDNEIYKLNTKLVIHTQKNIDNIISREVSKKYEIEIICKSVQAPGLYHLGDVYVYPAKLDGLGLTMYEALSCGLPVIATDIPPMNEVVNNQNGRLVEVESMFSRSDGYYWPLAIVSEEALKNAMLYYVKNANKISEFANEARKYAVENLNLMDQKKKLLDYLQKVRKIDTNEFCKECESRFSMEKKSARNHFVVSLLPSRFESYIRNKIEQDRTHFMH